jgi:hypothetical protein
LLSGSYNAAMEDLDLFLVDFGVPVTSGGVSGVGILDMPSEIVADGVVLTTDYKVTVKTSQFGGLIYGAGVTVDGVNYQVREAMKIDDGNFTDLMLTRVPPESSAPGQDPREFGLGDLADVSLTGAQQGDVLINDGNNWVNTPDIDGGGA